MPEATIGGNARRNDNLSYLCMGGPRFGSLFGNSANVSLKSAKYFEVIRGSRYDNIAGQGTWRT
jgi:hypothetical protein